MMLSTGNKSRTFYPAMILCLGLWVAQVIATLQVYLSNIDFHRTLSLIKANGYVTVPSELIADRLLAFTPAFVGGLFFTCSIGAGLSLFTLGAVWCWDRLFNRNRIVFGILVLLWLACVAGVNWNGFSPLVTLYVVILPVFVSVVSLKWIRRGTHQEQRVRPWGHVIPVIVLALLWTSQQTGSFFLDIRDNLLLTNSWGTAFSDRYYEYTLYPARVIKPLGRKTLKTYTLSGIKKESEASGIQQNLLHQDYLPVPDGSSADLDIVRKDTDLVFYHRHRSVLKMMQEEFSADPVGALKRVSSKSDRHHVFRQLIYISLLLGFPLALYVLLYALLRFVCSFCMSVGAASIAASALCCLIGLSLFFLFQHHRKPPVAPRDIPAALASEHWQDKVAALKTISRKAMELDGSLTHLKLSNSPHIPVRYWLAKALATDRKPDTVNHLVALLDDPNPNVICMALASLGRQKDRAVVGTIINVIETSDHWYVQDYAYRALRRLGWTQTKSK
ncbi:MAG: HEAT repeat domain-containing protein [Desulfobacterales bacterium]